MALSDQGSTLFRKSTPLRKSPNSIRKRFNSSTRSRQRTSTWTRTLTLWSGRQAPWKERCKRSLQCSLKWDRLTNTPAVSVEICDDGSVAIQSEVPNGQYRLVVWEQTISGSTDDGVQSRAALRTSYSGWKDESCVSTRQNETHWTMPGHARRSVWRLSRIPGEKDPENGRVRVSAKKQNKGLWKRILCTKSRLHDQFSHQKIHSKEVRSARKGSKASSHVQISCARSTHEGEGYLQTVTSKSPDLVV